MPRQTGVDHAKVGSTDGADGMVCVPYRGHSIENGVFELVDDTSLSGNFTLVHDKIQVQFGISISHTYSMSTTATANVPPHYQARFRSRYKVWSNYIHQFNWNGRTCSDVGYKTKTAKHFVRFEAQVIPCNPPCP
jgi:hypothetical protein